MKKFELDIYERKHIIDRVNAQCINEEKLKSYERDSMGEEEWDEKEEWNAKCESIIEEVKNNDLEDVFQLFSLCRDTKRQNIVNYIESLKFRVY